MYKVLFVIIAATLSFNATAQDSAMHKSLPVSVVNTNFPFIVSLTTIEYDVTLNLKDQKVIDKYSAVFKKHNLKFTPEVWEDVIVGILQNKDEKLAQQITTASIDGVLRIGTGGTDYQKIFLAIMLPIFGNLERLDEILAAD